MTRVLHDTVISAGRSLEDIHRTFRKLLQLCCRKAPSLEDLLLRDGNPIVEAELLRRTAAGQGSSTAGGQGLSWVPEHQKLYASLRVPWGAKSPFPRTESSPWFKVLTPAYKSSLIYKQHKCMAGRPGHCSRCPDLLYNLDQSPDRTAQSTQLEDGRHRSCCMLPGQEFWVHRRGGSERLFLGYEALLLQGFPASKVETALSKVSNRFAHDLAGNAMTCQVTLAVVQSIMAALTWRNSEDKPATASSADTDDAMDLFAQLARGG